MIVLVVDDEIGIDPHGGTGIVVGGQQPWELADSRVELDMSAAEVREAFLLEPEALRRATRDVRPITDDNQRLSYGLDRLTRSGGERGRRWFDTLGLENLEDLQRVGSTP